MEAGFEAGFEAGIEMVSFGSVFLEVVFGHCERLPLPGEEIYVDSFAFSCGGAINSAVAASRAGAVAGLATLLGDDLGSRLVEELCARERVDLSPSERLGGPIAGITVALNFDGDRAFISHMPPRPPGHEVEVKRWSEVLQRVRPAWCYLHAGPGIAELMAEAHTVGTRVALDTNFGEIDDFAETVVQCARLADLFLPTEEELLRLTGAPDLAGGIALAEGVVPAPGGEAGPAGAVAAEGGPSDGGHRRSPRRGGAGPHGSRRRLRRGRDRQTGAWRRVVRGGGCRQHRWFGGGRQAGIGGRHA